MEFLNIYSAWNCETKRGHVAGWNPILGWCTSDWWCCPSARKVQRRPRSTPKQLLRNKKVQYIQLFNKLQCQTENDYVIATPQINLSMILSPILPHRQWPTTLYEKLHNAKKGGHTHTHTHTHNIFIPFHLYFWLLIKTDLSRWICEVVFAERRNQKGEGG
jgi:hypothetical protein